MRLSAYDATSGNVLGDRFYFSRKRKVGGCTWRVQTAWPHLGSPLEITWLSLGGPFLSFLA